MTVRWYALIIAVIGITAIMMMLGGCGKRAYVQELRPSHEETMFACLTTEDGDLSGKSWHNDRCWQPSRNVVEVRQ